MELQNLQVKTREAKGKGAARRTRRELEVPAVIYGEGQAPVSVRVPVRAFDKMIHGAMGEHALVQLDVADHPELSGPALLKAVQHHPVRSNVVHADFLRIRLDARLHTVVPVVLVGRSRGVVDGGVSDHQMHELEIECMALDVPAQIEIDITDLGMGDSLHVSQLTPPPGVTITSDPERTVIAIHAPRVADTTASLEEGQLAEPEVAARGKQDAKD